MLFPAGWPVQTELVTHSVPAVSSAQYRSHPDSVLFSARTRHRNHPSSAFWALPNDLQADRGVRAVSGKPTSSETRPVYI